jgi:hypothetical protein
MSPWRVIQQDCTSAATPRLFLRPTRANGEEFMSRRHPQQRVVAVGSAAPASAASFTGREHQSNVVS